MSPCWEHALLTGLVQALSEQGQHPVVIGKGGAELKPACFPFRIQAESAGLRF